MRMALTRTVYSANFGLAAAAVCITGLLMLSGCDEQPYPAPVDTAPPTAPPPSGLMGAPENAAPTTPTPPAYVPPPPAYAPPTPESSTSVVAMAPIPNPGDPGSEPYYAAPDRRVHDSLAVASGEPAPAAPRVGHRRHQAGTGHLAVAPVGAAAASGAGHPQKVQHTPAAPARTPTTLATAASTTPAANAPGASALQASLAERISKTAVLNAPEQFTVNQSTDVSLTIPANFADTVKSEAQKDGLSGAAASVTIAANLAGDGYTVLPAAVQTSPLTSGQATEFDWTVTRIAGAAGPLHADVGATLLGGGTMPLTLGSVQKAAPSGFKLTPRVVGASLLVLIGGLIVTWLARGRGERATATRRSTTPTPSRPLDISGDAPPT